MTLETRTLYERLRTCYGNTFMAHDCQLAANRLDEAVTLCDRAQDYLSIMLHGDARADALATELREFIERVEHVCVPDAVPLQCRVGQGD